MKKIFNDRVIKYIIIIPIVSLILLSSILIYVVTNNQKQHLKEDAFEIKSKYLKNHKDIIKDKVNQAISLIEYKKNLKNISDDLVKRLVANRLSKFRFGEKGYIYIVNGDGKLLAHRNSELIGSDAFSIKDPKGKFYMKDGYKIAKKYGEGFLEYISVTNADKTWNNKKKLTYVKYYPDFDWAINAGIYITDMDTIIATKIAHSKEHYSKQNNFLILFAILITLAVIAITVFLAKNIASKLYRTNKILQNKVDAQINELKENLGFMNKLLDTIPVPIFIKDKDFKYIKCNNAFCDFFNLTKDEIIGKTIYDLSSKELADQHHIKDMELIKIEKQYYKYEIKKQNNNASTQQEQEDKKIVEIYKTSYHHNYIFAGIIGVIIDITLQERKKLKLQEVVFNKTMQNIAQTKKFEEEQLKNIKFTAIGQLAAGITHEINTPLTYIKGNFEMMQYDIEDLPSSDIKLRMLEDSHKITDGINRLSNIVESMREMSQKSKESKEDTNIYHTLITSLTLLFNRSKQISKIKINNEDFNIGINRDKEIFISCVQKQRIEQVWVVIINNALDELVKIDIFENRLIDINIAYDIDNKYIIVKIKDNAGGVPKDIINNVFEPFVSSKESSGMGVGLNVAKKIINEQNGNILVYNEEGGAVFEVKLPSGIC